jgi:putative tricarboxylic transport membrane protein
VIVLVFLLFSTNWLTRIIEIPTRLIGITILLLSFVGVYSLRNSITDCAMAAGFGVFGLVLKRLNLPIVPIILGMVLGGIMEVKLRSSMPRVKTPLDMIDRPIAMIIFALIVIVIAMHIRTLIKERRNPPQNRDADVHLTQEGDL